MTIPTYLEGAALSAPGWEEAVHQALDDLRRRRSTALPTGKASNKKGMRA